MLRYVTRRSRELFASLLSPAGALAAIASLLLFLGAVTGVRWTTGIGVLLLGATLIVMISRQRLSWNRIAHTPSVQTELASSRQNRTTDPTAYDRLEDEVASALEILGIHAQRSSPLITVVVPVFNEERFLPSCLDSLLNQTWRNWKCVIVDDASTDDSLSIARRYATLDSRFTVIRHYENSGLPATRNTGLRATQTPWVTFLDADDLLLAESLRDRMKTAAGITDPNVAGIFCGVRQYPQEIQLEELPELLPWNPPPFQDYLTTRGECPFNAHAPILRTELVTAFGGFDESMRQGAEDWKLWLRLMRAGYYFLPSDHTTAIYRQKRRSMVRTMPTGHLEEAQHLLAWVHLPLSDDPAVSAGPSPYTQPISAYDYDLALTRRVIGYSGLAALAHASGELAAAIDKIPPELPAGWDRHIDLDSILDASYQRALAIDKSSYDLVRPHLLKEMGAIRSVLTDRQPEHKQSAVPYETKDKKDPIVVLLPANASQVETMDELVRDIVTHAMFAVTDRWVGRQGVSDALTKSSLPFESLHSLASSDIPIACIVIAEPSNALARGYAKSMADHGANVITLDTPVDRIDNSPDPIGHLLRPDEAARILAQLEAHPDITARSAGSEFWTPLSSLAAVEEAGSAPDYDKLARFKGQHTGERVFIIGNGPSLNELDLKKLRDEWTIAVNGIFLAREEMGFDPSYYVVEDTSVMRENLNAIIDYPAHEKLFPTIYRPLIPRIENVTFFQMNRGFYASSSPHYCIPRFSTDAASVVFSGQSVTIINLQLAYYLGFSEVILIGMDFSYSIPDSATRNGDIITSTTDDPNHFHPDYFGAGKTWKDPKLDRVLVNYQLAKLMFESDGRRIVNATAGGNLELFERIRYDSLFEGADS